MQGNAPQHSYQPSLSTSVGDSNLNWFTTQSSKSGPDGTLIEERPAQKSNQKVFFSWFVGRCIVCLQAIYDPLITFIMGAVKSTIWLSFCHSLASSKLWFPPFNLLNHWWCHMACLTLAACSVDAIRFENWFCASKKGGIGEDGRVSARGAGVPCTWQLPWWLGVPCTCQLFWWLGVACAWQLPWLAVAAAALAGHFSPLLAQTGSGTTPLPL